MNYPIEYRSSWRDGEVLVQDLGGNFHEFDAVDDADAHAKAQTEWRALMAKARERGLRSVGFVRLERAPNQVPVTLPWTPFPIPAG